jgi:hypothetical protein
MVRQTTSRRGRRATGIVLALALGAPAVAAAAIIPDVPDAPAGAQAIESLPDRASEVVERPGDQDWYSIAGRNADDSVNTVFVRVLATTPSCPGPVKVALFNPERRWMRSSQATRGNVATMLVPRKPSRYLVDVNSTDPACAGLEYEVSYVNTDRPTPDSTASKCLVARAKRIDAKDRLDMLVAERPKYAPDARPRYDAYIAKAKTALAAARRSEKRVCK